MTPKTLSLGKGEAESSILSNSTIFCDNARWTPLLPDEPA